MEFDETLITSGIFQQELGNRFKCSVKVGNRHELCYVASSCRLTNFIELDGKEVLLTPSVRGKELRYTLFAVQQGNHFTILNLSIANAVIFEQLHRRLFSFLGKRNNIQRELTVGDYKTDIFIKDSQTIIEVKAIISSGKQAQFPSGKSDRRLQQLEKIKLLLHSGYKVCYFFVSLSPEVTSIKLDRSNQFYSLFLDCVNCGMSYYGYSLKMNSGEINVASKLEVLL